MEIINSITATNLISGQSVSFTGNGTLVLDQSCKDEYFISKSVSAKVYPNPFPGESNFEFATEEP